MAIYHLSVKTVSRSTGRSAVAAAAYRAGERLTNEADGAAHDYEPAARAWTWTRRCCWCRTGRATAGDGWPGAGWTGGAGAAVERGGGGGAAGELDGGAGV